MTPLLILALLINISTLAGSIVNVIWNETGGNVENHTRLGWALMATAAITLGVTAFIAGLHWVRVKHKRDMSDMSAKFAPLDGDEHGAWPPPPPPQAKGSNTNAEGKVVYDL